MCVSALYFFFLRDVCHSATIHYSFLPQHTKSETSHIIIFTHTIISKHVHQRTGPWKGNQPNVTVNSVRIAVQNGNVDSHSSARNARTRNNMKEASSELDHSRLITPTRALSIAVYHLSKVKHSSPTSVSHFTLTAS